MRSCNVWALETLELTMMRSTGDWERRVLVKALVRVDCAREVRCRWLRAMFACVVNAVWHAVFGAVFTDLRLADC